jgi:GNAT superfamily N-acetyltransferase/SAM-dependent methyltransferase
MVKAAIQIAVLETADVENIYGAFADSGWYRPVGLIEQYVDEIRSGERITLVARANQKMAGYVTVKWQSDYLPFATRQIPEIQDLNVVPPFQRQGIASRLVDEAERLIFDRYPIAGISVGLYTAYGAAQRMYVRRGYVPDGTGIAYKGNLVRPYREVRVDDDLVLYLVKSKYPYSPATEPDDLFAEWFEAMRSTLESSYVQRSEPWGQSGLMISDENAWEACRKPIADCIDRSGSFLDIGCANGYLLEKLIEWIRERGLRIIPYGLDLSNKLIELAKARLPLYKDNFFVGNALNWKTPAPPRFDYVRTEIVYVPEILQKRYVEGLIDYYLKPEGRLLLTEYRSRRDLPDKPWIDITLTDWDISVEYCKSGFYDGKEVTRVFVIAKPPVA